MSERRDSGEVASVHRLLLAGRRWILTALGAGILLGELALTGFLAVTEPVVGLLAVLSAVPAFGLAAYVWWTDPALREPPGPLVVTFVLAVLLAGVAAVVNTVAAVPLDALPAAATAGYFFVLVAPVEEAVKLVAVLIHAVYNTVVTFVPFTVVGFLSFVVVYDGLFAVVLVRTVRRYASLYPDREARDAPTAGE